MQYVGFVHRLRYALDLCLHVGSGLAGPPMGERHHIRLISLSQSRVLLSVASPPLTDLARSHTQLFGLNGGRKALPGEGALSYPIFTSNSSVMTPS